MSLGKLGNISQFQIPQLKNEDKKLFMVIPLEVEGRNSFYQTNLSKNKFTVFSWNDYNTWHFQAAVTIKQNKVYKTYNTASGT